MTSNEYENLTHNVTLSLWERGNDIAKIRKPALAKALMKSRDLSKEDAKRVASDVIDYSRKKKLEKERGPSVENLIEAFHTHERVFGKVLTREEAEQGMLKMNAKPHNVKRALKRLFS